MHDLLSESWSKPIKEYISKSERINYYLHDLYETINTQSNGNVFTHGFDNGELSFIKDTFNYLDNKIDLDFTRVYDPSNADIRIFKADSATKLLGDENVLGYAQPMIDGSKAWMEIWWNNKVPDYTTNFYTEYENLSEIESYTILHEIGHALGLDHPRNDPWANWHDSTDTIMSYNSIFNDNKTSLNYSESDITTLELLWGKENDNNSNQSKIENSPARAEIFRQISELAKAEDSKIKEDELLGEYKEADILQYFSNDELLSFEQENLSSTMNIDQKERFNSLESNLLNKISEFNHIITDENDNLSNVRNYIERNNQTGDLQYKNGKNDILDNNPEFINLGIDNNTFI